MNDIVRVFKRHVLGDRSQSTTASPTPQRYVAHGMLVRMEIQRASRNGCSMLGGPNVRSHAVDGSTQRQKTLSIAFLM